MARARVVVARVRRTLGSGPAHRAVAKEKPTRRGRARDIHGPRMPPTTHMYMYLFLLACNMLMMTQRLIF